MMVYITHQYGVDFDLIEPGGKRGINTVHHLLEFILPGNGMKLTGIRAVHADVNGR